MKRAWSEIEVSLLRSIYPEAHTDDIAALMERTTSQVYNAAFKYGLKKSAEYLESDASGRATHARQSPGMIAARIKPGAPPWNKGLRGVNGTSATTFKPGSKPQTWVPIGSESVNKEGQKIRKVSDTGNRLADWQREESILWVSAHGPVPAGRMVVIKNKALPLTLDNLECLTRAELMTRNSYHNNYPPEVARLIQLRGALNRQINKRREK